VAAAVVAGALCASAEIHVLCTTTIVGDVVANVAGSDVSVDVLLPVNADPHAFEATPRDAVSIAHADVIFQNGAGLEGFLAPFLGTTAGRVVDLSQGLALRSLGPDHDAGTTDPHVWLDPTNVIAWVGVVAEVLSNLDPHHADGYHQRATAYAQTLRDLDTWIVERVSRIPVANRKLVTDHDAFGYFADRYGFTLVGTVFPGLSPLAEPSAKGLAALESAILEVGVPAIFVGTTVDPSLAAQVAVDTGVRLVTVYTGSLSDAWGPAPTYVELLHYDVSQIVAGLTGES
jgi:ABC-type Zn uptake system ZnuABC Zn-binding protein ZnuA